MGAGGGRTECAGAPLPSAQVRIEEASDGIGEITLREPGGKDGARIRTGEAGSLDADGRLWLHGKMADFVRTAMSVPWTSMPKTINRGMILFLAGPSAALFRRRVCQL